ncbi:hypothetical protein [Streptomyces sp. NPDC020377]
MLLLLLGALLRRRAEGVVQRLVPLVAGDAESVVEHL